MDETDLDSNGEEKKVQTDKQLLKSKSAKLRNKTLEPLIEVSESREFT